MSVVRSLRHASSVVFLIALALAVGCDSDAKCGNGSRSCSSDAPDKPDDRVKPGSFESDLPGSAPGGRAVGGPASGAAGAAATAPTTAAVTPNSAQDASSGAAARAIVEADMIQLDGDRLYALSRVAGLAIVDVSDPAHLKLLGRYRDLPAEPFEMYLRGDVAVVMFSGWGQYVADDKGSYSWVSTSKVVSLDIAAPSAVAKLGSFDVPGTISDSRIVGDVLYVVAREDGYCWRCEQNSPTTTIVSLDVSSPREMRKVDQLRYRESMANYSWQRSISVTDQRMYVAGPEYGQNGPVGSSIQVVDISDPKGDLVEGALLKARGQINNRWQMDEYAGVLRVLSQTPSWQTSEKPLLQTFKVVSSQEFKPLAQLTIQMPPNETLRSTRFDGVRGYLITAEQKDPLFTLDLSDPAAPKQVGELVMPGWVYHMEPRGDRVLGLGFDQGNPAGSITVSLFDVSDLAAPKMLSRVNFGGDWGSLPEDQDRIHKVFRVLPDAGLILVPFSGYSRTDKQSYDCGGKNIGGVQLVGYADDTLTLRGSASSTGQARRALIHRDHLFSISDQRVEAFDIADRSAPKAVSQLIMANTVLYATTLDNDVVARVTTPAWDGRYFVETVASASADDPNSMLGQLSLDGVFSGDDSCNRWWNILSYHADGSRLYLMYEGYRYDGGRGGTSERETGVVVIDTATPSAPKLAGQVKWTTQESQFNNWYPYYASYGYGSFGWQSPYLWHGSVFAYLEQQQSYEQQTGRVLTSSVRMRVVDLHDANDLKATTLTLPTDQIYLGLIADGDRIWTSHYAPPAGTASSTRFYADSIDVSNPSAPKLGAPINIPGTLVHYESASGRGVTSELKAVTLSDVRSEECYQRFANADFRYPESRSFVTDTSTGTCTGYLESLHLIQLREDGAVLEDTLKLAENQRVGSWSATDGRLYATLARGTYYGYPRASGCFDGCGAIAAPVELLVLGNFASGKFGTGRLQVDQNPNAWWGWWGSPPILAHGDRALILSNGDAAIIDASVLESPKVARTVPLFGSVSRVEVAADGALLSLYDRGVQRIQW